MKDSVLNKERFNIKKRRTARCLTTLLMLISLLTLAFLSIFIGVRNISVSDIFNLDQDDVLVMAVSRLPRLFAILIAGVGMSVSGLIVQQISLNKFVSPTTMGTLDGTKLGILLSMIIFPASGVMTKMVFAFAIAIMASFIFLTIASKVRSKSIIFVPLIGIVFGNIISSSAAFFAYRYNVVQNMEAWLIGDFSYIIKGNYEILYLAIPVVIVSYLYAQKFTIAGLGKDMASSLGLSHLKIVYIGIILVSICSAVVVLTAGAIPFLGLIVPNVISLLYGDNLSKTLPYTALFGAIFLLICDMVSRTLAFPYEIPIGLTVSIIGGIVFIALVLKKMKYV